MNYYEKSRTTCFVTLCTRTRYHAVMKRLIIPFMVMAVMILTIAAGCTDSNASSISVSPETVYGGIRIAVDYVHPYDKYAYRNLTLRVEFRWSNTTNWHTVG